MPHDTRDTSLNRKFIITVAPTGATAAKSQSPHLPTQPAKIAASVAASHREGTAIDAHHARCPDDGATCNDAIYRDINQRVRAECDIIINNSTGGGSSGDMLFD